MLIPALLMAAALTGVQTPGGPQPQPDGAVATAPATTAALDATAHPVAPAIISVPSADPLGLSTDAQIALWLAGRAPESAPSDTPAWRDEGRLHGEFSVGFGTGGYRDYGAAASLPIGEGGRLDISVRQIENGYPGGYGYGYGYGYDYDHSPYFHDGGYVFPGNQPGAAIEYESRVARPEGPLHRWPAARPVQAAEN